MYILLVSKEGYFMRCEPGISLSKWALPLGLDFVSWYCLEVRFLCFTFMLARGKSRPVADEVELLIAGEGYKGSPPPAEELAGVDDGDDMFDDEYEDEEAEEEETTSA